MSAQVVCPSCSTAYHAAPHLAGKRVNCPTCQHPLHIPPAAPTNRVAIAAVGVVVLAVVAAGGLVGGYRMKKSVENRHLAGAVDRADKAAERQKELEAEVARLDEQRTSAADARDRVLSELKGREADIAAAEVARAKAEKDAADARARTRVIEAQFAAADKGRPRPNPPAAPPLVESYLHSGDLARGELQLQRALERAPADDQARFGLGVLQFVRAVERLGQSLHTYGVKSDNTNLPFLRIPVPKNPTPSPVTYAALRRVFEQFTDDLAKAEATLAEVTDANVALPLRMANVKLDLTGGGTPTDKLLDVLKKLAAADRFDFLQANPDFLVRFDRGDVAWLRGYCHLLSAMLDVYLAIDGKFIFDIAAPDHFADPRGLEPANPNLFMLLQKNVTIRDPGRLRSFRRHLLKVCELNRESWLHIRAETDDDHEWLPSAKQKGVLGLPVTDEMIDGWLAAVGELEAVLKGRKLVGLLQGGKGINLMTFLEDPPAKISVMALAEATLDAKYVGDIRDENAFDIRVFERVMRVFGDSSTGVYAAWFN